MMKYQKAVEKAKQAHWEETDAWNGVAADDQTGPEKTPPEPLETKAPDQPQTAAAGTTEAKTATASTAWTPPVYIQSRKAKPDAATVAKHRLLCLTPDAPEQEYYKVLRTQLMQRMQPKGWNTLMITSVGQAEGKSLTSINLAAVIAKSFDQTVLLVDCDLRRQSIWRYMGLPGDKGIADYLTNGSELKDLLIWPEIEKMTLISGGQEVTDSAELLGSLRMRELMAELKCRYTDRFIIVDAPPILSGADTMAMAANVDGIVVVVESGKTPLKEIQNAMERVPKEKFLGFVLNKHTGVDSLNYIYYYKH